MSSLRAKALRGLRCFAGAAGFAQPPSPATHLAEKVVVLDHPEATGATWTLRWQDLVPFPVIGALKGTSMKHPDAPNPRPPARAAFCAQAPSLALLLGLAGSALPAAEITVTNLTGRAWSLEPCLDPAEPRGDPGGEVEEQVLGPDPLARVRVEAGDAGIRHFRLRDDGATVCYLRVTHPEPDQPGETTPRLEVLPAEEGKGAGAAPCVHPGPGLALTLALPAPGPGAALAPARPAGAPPQPRMHPANAAGWMSEVYGRDLRVELAPTCSPAALKALEHPLQALAANRKQAAKLYAEQVKLINRLLALPEAAGKTSEKADLLAALKRREAALRTLFRRAGDELIPAVQSVFFRELRARQARRAVGGPIAPAAPDAQAHLAHVKELREVGRKLARQWDREAERLPWMRWRATTEIHPGLWLLELLDGWKATAGKRLPAFIHTRPLVPPQPGKEEVFFAGADEREFFLAGQAGVSLTGLDPEAPAVPAALRGGSRFGAAYSAEADPKAVEA